MTKGLVISTYEQDLSWLDKIEDKSINIYLYEKNNRDLISTDKIKLVKLNNLGREPHSFLYHIIENYNNLDDIIFFTQDKPFDHCSNFLELLKINEKGWYANIVLTTTMTGYPNQPGLPISEFLEMIHIDFKGSYIQFRPGCIFSLKKEDILIHSKDFYINIFELIEKHYDPNDKTRYPIGLNGIPWILERVMGLIFNLKV